MAGNFPGLKNLPYQKVEIKSLFEKLTELTK